MLGKATRRRKRMELLHGMLEGRHYGQLKDSISHRSRWRQDSEWECMSETCWKQQKTKEIMHTPFSLTHFGGKACTVVSKQIWDTASSAVAMVMYTSSNNIMRAVYTASQKNDTDVAHYNFDGDRPIWIISGRDVAERVCYQTVIWFVILTS